jgi:HAD superfamily hydrolase (TIGR01509 family)
MSIKSVIFDMDGVIIDSEPEHLKVNEKMLGEFHINVSEEEKVKFVGTTTREIWKMLKQKYEIPYSLDELVNMDRDIYLDGLRSKDSIKPIEGVDKLIIKLNEKKLKVGVASSSSLNIINITISSLGLDKYFGYLTGGDEVENSKPAPDIFLKAAKRMKSSPEECIVIEDSKNGVCAAKSAGMYCVGFKNPHSGNQDISKADIIIEKFNSLYPILEEKFNF